MEKPPFSIRYMPFNFSYLNEELFASIDDDRGIKNYSLVSRVNIQKELILNFQALITKHQSFFDNFLFRKT